jgi:hypothetical protein
MSQARRALEVVCFLSHSDEFVSVRLLTSQPQSCECGRRSIRFVRLALKVFMQNDRDFAGVILLYKYFEVICKPPAYQHNLQECNNLHSHRRENLKSHVHDKYVLKYMLRILSSK